MKKIIALTLALVLCFGLVSCASNSYCKKLEKWVTFLSDESAKSDPNFSEKVKNMNMELNLAFYSSADKIPMNAVKEFVSTHDTERLLNALTIASANANRYADNFWVFYEAIYETFPDKFSTVILDNGATSGYYIENPTATPGVSREEPSDVKLDDVDIYTVTHYGDFAVEEGSILNYGNGKLGWEDGVFIDSPDHYYREYEAHIYYKGVLFHSFFEKDWQSELSNIIAFEGEDYIYKFIAGGEHLERGGRCEKPAE